jgi:hypothetical protein
MTESDWRVCTLKHVELTIAIAKHLDEMKDVNTKRHSELMKRKRESLPPGCTTTDNRRVEESVILDQAKRALYITQKKIPWLALKKGLMLETIQRT